MKCEAGGECKRAQPCEHACDLRIQSAQRDGWNACMVTWADHMKRMVVAINAAPKGQIAAAAHEQRSEADEPQKAEARAVPQAGRTGS